MIDRSTTGAASAISPGSSPWAAGITRRNLLLFLVLLALPNLLGVINIPTPWGNKFHFFQAGIILASLVFGPLGGAAAGATGSVYSALALGNPYIVLGNIILGFFTGLFLRRRIPLVPTVLTAFVIQVVWLWPSDVYFQGMPVPAVNSIVVGLLLSNAVWALVIQLAAEFIERRRGNSGASS